MKANELLVGTADNNELLTREQVAQCLKVCPHTVARWTRRGLLPVLRINCRVIRYRAGDVQNILDGAASPI